MTWKDYQREDLSAFSKYLDDYIRIICGALPAGYSLKGKSQEEVEKEQGGMGPWRWYAEQGGMSNPDRSVPVILFGGLFVKRHIYSRLDNTSQWIERNTKFYPEQITIKENVDVLETLEISPYNGFLCSVIREWVPYIGNTSYNSSLKEEIENHPKWQEIIEAWPSNWRSMKNLENDGIEETELGKFLHIDGPDILRHPITGKISKVNKELVYTGKYMSIVSEIKRELAMYGLPFDEKTALYTLWRILGGSIEDAPDCILPERGGWVITFVMAHSQNLDNGSHNAEISKLSYKIKLSDGSNINYEDMKVIGYDAVNRSNIYKFDKDTFFIPFPHQIVISSGAWMRDENWDKQAGKVREKHQKWVEEMIEKHGFLLPLNNHHRDGRINSKSQKNPRGRPLRNTGRWNWYKCELNNPEEVSNLQVYQRAILEYNYLIETDTLGSKSLSSIKADIRKWVQKDAHAKVESLKKT